MKNQISIVAAIGLASIIIALSIVKGFSMVAESIANKGIPVSGAAPTNLNSVVNLPGNRFLVIFDAGDESYLHVYQTDGTGHIYTISNSRIQNIKAH